MPSYPPNTLLQNPLGLYPLQPTHENYDED